MNSFVDIFDGSLPLERASTIPSRWYFDPEIYQAERKSVFSKTWQAVGRKDQLEKPGSFFTAQTAGEPVVVVRTKTGELRAFSNVCRHKATKVVLPEEGMASFFQCRYHGWTYDLNGNLKGTPEFDGVLNFEKESLCLPRWEVATWGPLVFVHFGQPQMPLEKFINPLPEKTASLHLEKLKFVGRKKYDLRCNWKVFVDNFLDGGYHVNTIHPGLAGVINYSKYTSEIYPHCSVQISPLKKDSADSSVAQVRAGDTAFYWWLFPNLMVNAYEGVMDTNLVIPTGPDTCTVIFDFYFENTQGMEAQKYIETSQKVAHQVQIEDLEICEDVQRGLTSHTYDTGRFSVRREKTAYAFHQLLARMLRAKSDAVQA